MPNSKSQAASKAEYQRMMHWPIPKLLLSLSLPTMGSMLITSLYNLADTLFVSRLGTQATGAVGITFSLMALIQAIGFTLGMGGGSLISLQLGRKAVRCASDIASVSFALALLCGLLVATGIFWRAPIMCLLGATESILPYALDYSFFIFLAAPLMTGALCLTHLLRAEGKTAHVLIAIAFSGLLNILLDALLVAPLGVRGISLATFVSQGLALFLLLSPYLKGKTSLQPTIPSFGQIASHAVSILTNGLPSLLRQGLAAVSAILLSRSARLYGDAAVAAMSIAGKIFMIPFTLMLGYGQGLQPLIGFNFAKKNTRRIRRAAHSCLWTGTAALTLLGFLLFWQAPKLVQLFSTDTAVIQIASYSLRASALTLPLLPACSIANLGFQAIRRPLTASFLAAARQGLFFIPLLLLLPGLWGVQTAQALADAATFALSLPFLIYFLRKAVDNRLGKV